MKGRFYSKPMVRFQIGSTKIIFEPSAEGRAVILQELVHPEFELRHGDTITHIASTWATEERAGRIGVLVAGVFRDPSWPAGRVR